MGASRRRPGQTARTGGARASKPSVGAIGSIARSFERDWACPLGAKKGTSPGSNPTGSPPLGIADPARSLPGARNSSVAARVISRTRRVGSADRAPIASSASARHGLAPARWPGKIHCSEASATNSRIGKRRTRTLRPVFSFKRSLPSRASVIQLLLFELFRFYQSTK